MTNPEIIPPDPEPLDPDRIIKELKAIEIEKNTSGFVARFSPWVGYPEKAMAMYEQISRELYDKFSIDFYSRLNRAREITNNNKSRAEKFGSFILSKLRDIV